MSNKSLVAICLSIIIGFAMLSASVIYGFKTYTSTVEVTNMRYEMVANGYNVFVFDKATGTYWQKFIDMNEGPTDWTKETVPIE